MRWASAVSDHPELERALEDCAASVSAALEGARPDLLVAFVAGQPLEACKRLPELLRQRLGRGLVLGCTAGGVIGGGHEVEQGPGFSLTVAEMPDVRLTPFALTDGKLPGPDAPPERWEALVHVGRAWHPQFLLLADPFTLRAEELLTGLDYAFGESIKTGGLASGGDRPGSNLLFLGQEALREGAAGVALAGNVLLDSVVAQGCRPIGAPMLVSRCRGNVLLELEGRPVLDVIRALYGDSAAQDRPLFREALSLGLAMDELRSEYGPGDFLVRNILGLDQQRGGIIVGAMLRENTTVQFHLRDGATATEEVLKALTRYRSQSGAADAQGALLFSHLGRGAHLFGRPDHDTDLFRALLGPVPLGGCFCNGEIGQVGRTTYLHGQTSSFGVFRPRWAG
ncbi:MAG: FIST C-terminal domain-containing protein [Chloroflexi bacterium]|nr:FIST C-terminal domain-containing protein [Chloroflexota bacterium]